MYKKTQFREDNFYFEVLDLKSKGINIFLTKTNFGTVNLTTRANISDKILKNDKILISATQAHGDNVELIEDLEQTYFEDTDGFITKREDVALMCKFADCLPICFVDMRQRIIGIVHSGWKGTYQEIIIKAIDKLCSNYNSKLEDIKVVFGAGICQKNYEVQNDFLEKFEATFPRDIVDKAFKEENGRLFFDNQEFNALNLERKGILQSNIYRNDICTFEDSKFHSYRRDKEKSGRYACLIFME